MIDYWDKIKALAWAMKGDGCTHSPDLFYRSCCDEHDLHYITGMTVDGVRLTRKEADKRFLYCMRKNGRLVPILGTHIIPFFYYLAVRWFGEGKWDTDQPYFDPPE